MVMTAEDINKVLERCDDGTDIEIQLVDDSTGDRRTLEVDKVDLTLLGADPTLTVVVYDPEARNAFRRDRFCCDVADGVLSRLEAGNAPALGDTYKSDVRACAMRVAANDFDAGDVSVETAIEHVLATITPPARGGEIPGAQA